MDVPSPRPNWRTSDFRTSVGENTFVSCAQGQKPTFWRPTNDVIASFSKLHRKSLEKVIDHWKMTVSGAAKNSENNSNHCKSIVPRNDGEHL